MKWHWVQGYVYELEKKSVGLDKMKPPSFLDFLLDRTCYKRYNSELKWKYGVLRKRRNYNRISMRKRNGRKRKIIIYEE